MHLQEWRDASLSENDRQLAYAQAFQRLLWREMSNGHSIYSVGDTVTIKGYDGLRAGFPDAFDGTQYNKMLGSSGVVRQATRTMGADGRMYRAYSVRIRLHLGHFVDAWYTGDDLA